MQYKRPLNNNKISYGKTTVRTDEENGVIKYDMKKPYFTSTTYNQQNCLLCHTCCLLNYKTFLII